MSKTTTTPAPVAELPAGYADESSPFYVPAPLRDTYQSLSDTTVYPVNDPPLAEAVRSYARTLAVASLAERGIVRPDRGRVEDRLMPTANHGGAPRISSATQKEVGPYLDDLDAWHRSVTDEERKLARTDIPQRFTFHVWRLDTASRIVRQRDNREAIEAADRAHCPICAEVRDRYDIAGRPLMPGTTPHENVAAGWIRCCSDCYLVVIAEQTERAATRDRVAAVRKALGL